MKTEKANPLIIRHSIRHIIESIFNMFLQHFMIWKVVVAYKIYYKDILRINIVTKQTLHHVSITDMVFGLWILNTFHFFSSLRTTKLWCATLKHLYGIFFLHTFTIPPFCWNIWDKSQKEMLFLCREQTDPNLKQNCSLYIRIVWK